MKNQQLYDSFWEYVAAITHRDGAQQTLDKKYQEFYAQRILYLCRTGKAWQPN